MKRMNRTIYRLEVKEGPADCIRMAEVRAVLKKMKRHKAPRIVGDIGTQWILDLSYLQCVDAVGWAAGRASGL